MIDDSLGVAGGFVASSDGAAGDQRHGVFYAGDDRMAGPALIWAMRSEVDHLHLVAEADVAGALARRVSDVDAFRIDVVAVDGVDLVAAEPQTLPAPPVLGPEMWALAPILSEAGARPVDDHGRIVAEVAGLEVARIDTPTDQPAAIEVGVGEADRELHTLVHSNMDSGTAVRRAVTMVAAERQSGSMHPLARMARERWLRSTLLDDPASIGLASLTAVAPLVARSTVLGNVPSAAVGATPDGDAVVVVCSSGIDLDVVPEAVDYRRRESPDAALWIVVPQRDRHAITESIVAITTNCQLLSVDPPW